jgi:hypothetical protein
MILRLLSPQGIIGIAASLCLGLLLLVEWGETRHWKNQSGQFERLYRDEQAAHATTVANYRAAADRARADDAANAVRIRAAQATISQETQDAYEIRLADARARADRLRVDAETATGGRSGRATAVSGLSTSAGSSAQAAGKDGLPGPDALTATEQAIQLDELIRWVRKQHTVDPNAEPSRQQ